MDVSAVLQRINYRGSIEPTESALRGLHRAFVQTVPFENLDIHRNRRIVLDEQAFFRKIVQRRRGGFCYELNGLFAAVLRELGFDVALLSARVFTAEGEMGREFVHLISRVNLDQPWIADVGFGDWSSAPLRLAPGDEQLVDQQRYRVILQDERHIAQKQQEDASWKSRYAFTLIPRRLLDFAAICEDLQTAPDSFFRRHRMCTRATPDGRITLTEQHLIITANGERTEMPISDERAYQEALSKNFGIVLDD
jgi:N-hydroxyarylamine O-acetyltransferase